MIATDNSNNAGNFLVLFAAVARIITIFVILDGVKCASAFFSHSGRHPYCNRLKDSAQLISPNLYRNELLSEIEPAMLVSYKNPESSKLVEDCDSRQHGNPEPSRNFLKLRDDEPIVAGSYERYSRIIDQYIRSREMDTAKVYLENIVDLNTILEITDDAIPKKLLARLLNKVLAYWKKSNHPDSLTIVENLLHQMQEQNVTNHVSYSTYIALLANQGDTISAQKAQEVVEYMYEKYKNEAIVDLAPNSQTWNSVINAWVRCGNMPHAEEVLKRMEGFNEHYEHTTMSPNVISYTTIMDGYAKCIDPNGESISKIEAVFNRLCQTMKPNIWTYVTLVDAYTKQKNPQVEHVQKADDIVRSMYSLYKEDRKNNDKPNAQLVTMVIDAWKRSRSFSAAEKAENLLDWLISVYKDEKDLELSPNQYTFSSTIDAWAKSRNIDKAVRASNVLDKMNKLYESGVECAKPNAVCITAVINACAYSESDPFQKRSALKIAIGTYKSLQKMQDVQANTATYVNMITAIRNLVEQGNGRDAALKSIFDDACQVGLVDSMVIQRTKSGMSSKAFADSFSSFDVTLNAELLFQKVPTEWRRKVQQQRLWLFKRCC